MLVDVDMAVWMLIEMLPKILVEMQLDAEMLVLMLEEMLRV